ncbi:MAG: hypothetical protein QG671_797, partial [Actinomycetota bacterium]|nr:hypothetical protein [Actinomycetota bacterium]
MDALGSARQARKPADGVRNTPRTKLGGLLDTARASKTAMVELRGRYSKHLSWAKHLPGPAEMVERTAARLNVDPHTIRTA